MFFFSLNKDIASGPDGFSGELFQNCQDIIEKGIGSFICGIDLPKYINTYQPSSNPKKEIERMADLRPISLNTYINKVTSKVIYEIIMVYQPSII